MSAIVAAGVLALTSAGPIVSPPAVPPAQTSTIFDDARARQTFYPVGALAGDGMKMAYYVMGGRLSDRSRDAAKGAVLVNLAADRGVVQVVELQEVSCAAGRLTPTFRMMFDADGRALESSGPVQPQAQETLLSPDAVRRTLDILCNGAEPKDALTDRTLTELR